MILINKLLKRFGASATPLQSKSFKDAVIRLTISYTLAVGFILVMFSLIVYSSFYVFVEKRHFNTVNTVVSEFSSVNNEQNTRHEATEHLFSIILYADIVSFLVILFLAYFLAKKTLAPLELNYLQQKRFVSDTAHELRTPLSVIKAGNELSLQKDRTIDAYKKVLTINLEEVNRLITLTNELLFLAKPLKTVDKNSPPVNLSDICDKKIMLSAPYAATKAVVLKQLIDPNIRIFGRTEEIEQVVLNVLKNAIDYNKPGGEVQVIVGQRDGRAYVEISDTGVGISEPDQTLMFERFYKVDKARQMDTTSGAGLGLSIVKEIVTAHNGIIAVLSQENAGTTIVLEFPIFA